MEDQVVSTDDLDADDFAPVAAASAITRRDEVTDLNIGCIHVTEVHGRTVSLTTVRPSARSSPQAARRRAVRR